MSDRSPLVSIIITSYNRAHSIERAIQSALMQDYPNLELVISDNCSTDNSMEIIRRYEADPRVRISENETNLGMIPNYKKATEDIAKGEYITYISSDDALSDKHFISEAVVLSNKYPDVLLVLGKLQQFTPDGEIIGQTDEKPFWLKEFFPGKEVFLKYVENSWISWGACIMRTKELLELKPFDNPHTSKDIEVNLKLLLKGNACFINRFCYSQTIDFTNQSLSTQAEKKIQITEECFEGAYQAAIATYPEEKPLFDEWRTKVLETFFKQVLISLKIVNAEQFKIFLAYVKKNYNDIYNIINKDPRWKLMQALYHPVFFPALRILSPKRYNYFRKQTSGV